MLDIGIARAFADEYGAEIQRAGRGATALVIVDAAQPRSLSKIQVAIDSPLRPPLRWKELIPQLPNLRWIHSTSAGIDEIATPELARRSVLVTNSAGVYAPMMTEYILGMLVMVLRELPRYLENQQARRWDPGTVMTRSSTELYGKRLGIIGYGEVGRNLAQAARGFGMRVWGLRRSPGILANEPLERLLPVDQLDLLLDECDFVIISASLNSTTRALLGARELARMKPDAVLVNVGRGAIVDESALVETMRAGKLRAAVLDVTTREPLPPDSPLWTAPNVYLTPHISGNGPDGTRRAVELFCANLSLYVQGQPERMGNRVRLADHL